MNARTIPWESIADWYKENEQAIRDVMKFEGLRGAVNEVLRIAPEQPEVSALRESLDRLDALLSCMSGHVLAYKLSRQRLLSRARARELLIFDMQQRLTAIEQRNAELIELLRMAWGNDDIAAVDCRRIDAACAKPAESGADEPQCLLCLDAKTVPGDIPGEFVKDCPDCCGEEG